ncbi:hypothetical protein GCM10028778_07410 [Barrientosiimonas marina]|uniref:Zinc ribbon domain-containing protein n=1 Tax=Lentibacillus kimchii TaxID=1542911 RepID=A0ABW2UYJ9_9BACI
MLICPNCQHQQTSGNFCGVCGSTLEAEAGTNTANQDNHEQTAAAAEPVMNEQPADNTGEKIKDGLSHYGHYFLNLLKNPSFALQTHENEWLQALITLVITALASSLSIYFLMDSMINSVMGTMMGTNLPFFSTMLSVLTVSLIIIALAFVSTLIMAKAGRTPDSAKTIFTQFGSMTVPFATVNAVAILTALAGSFVFTLLLLAASNGLLLYVIPALMVYDKTNSVSRTGPKVYLSLAAVLIMLLFMYVISQLFFSEMISQITSMLNTPMGF